MNQERERCGEKARTRESWVAVLQEWDEGRVPYGIELQVGDAKRSRQGVPRWGSEGSRRDGDWLSDWLTGWQRVRNGG